MRIDSQRPGNLTFSVTPTAKCNVGAADLALRPRIARIEFRRPAEFSKRALPFTTAAMYRSADIPTIGATWLEFDGPVDLPQRRIIVTVAPVIKETQREMCIRDRKSPCMNSSH